MLTQYDTGFVGRSRELARIAAYVEQRAPGYLLIEAAGGLGKSALMAQVLLRAERGALCATQTDVVVFFVRDPVSHHADEFLTEINAQLLTLLARPGGTHYELRALRNQFSELWAEAQARASAERPLVLAVDGIDEQAPGEVTIAHLLPESLSTFVHVLVSSRPRPDVRDAVAREHPLRRADTLLLGGLESADVRAMLEGSGLSAGAAAILAPRVHSLARGEALLAKYICQDVASGGPAVLDDLEREPPHDIRDYFLREVRTIEETVADATWDVCSLLAVALGPLSAEEIADVLGVDLRNARRALKPVDRYLLGRERLELFHRNLYASILDEIGAVKAGEWRRRLTAWCLSKATSDEATPVPRYVLEHCARHLADGGMTRELLALVTERWLREHRRQFHALTRFARDVDLAYEAAARPMPAAAAFPLDALRMAILAASLGSAAQNVPPQAIWLLARLGRMDEAQGYADLAADPMARVSSLAAIAKALADGPDLIRARAPLERALHEVLEARGTSTVGEALADIVRTANAFAADSVALEVLSKLMALEAPFVSEVAQIAVIGTHANRRGDLEAVKRVQRYLEEMLVWFEATTARYVATRARLDGSESPPDGAEPFDLEQEDFDEQEDSFYDDVATFAEAVADFSARVGDVALAHHVERLTTSLAHDFLSSATLSRVAQALASQGDTTQALALARRAIELPLETKANALVPELYVISRLAECVALLTHLCFDEVRSGVVDHIARMCEELPDEHRWRGSEHLADALTAAGRPGALEALLAATTTPAPDYSNYSLRGLHAAVARGLIAHGRMDQAVNTMAHMPADVSRDSDRQRMLEDLLSAARVDLAERILEKIEYGPNRIRALATMAEHAERHGDRERGEMWLDRVLAASTVFGDESTRVALHAEVGRALAALARHDDARRCADVALALNARLAPGGKAFTTEVSLALLLIELGDIEGFLRVAPRRSDLWGMRFLSRYTDALMAGNGFHALNTFFFEVTSQPPGFLMPGDRAEHLAIRARVLDRMGYTTLARQHIESALDAAREGMEQQSPASGRGFAAMARYFARAGEVDRAVEMLERGLREGVGGFDREESLSEIAAAFEELGHHDRASAVAHEALDALDFDGYVLDEAKVCAALAPLPADDMTGAIDQLFTRARASGRAHYVRITATGVVQALQVKKMDARATPLVFETLPLFRGEPRNVLMWALAEWAPLLARLDADGLLRLCRWTDDVTSWWERA